MPPMPLPGYERHWRDAEQSVVGNRVHQQQPQEQHLGVRIVRSEDSRNPYLLQPCGTILPKQPSFRDIQKSPPVFRTLWGGQQTLTSGH